MPTKLAVVSPAQETALVAGPCVFIEPSEFYIRALRSTTEISLGTPDLMQGSKHPKFITTTGQKWVRMLMLHAAIQHQDLKESIHLHRGEEKICRICGVFSTCFVKYKQMSECFPLTPETLCLLHTNYTLLERCSF